MIASSGGDGIDVLLVDVRSAEGYCGEKIAPEESPETDQRAGHIPGARNSTWSEEYEWITDRLTDQWRYPEFTINSVANFRKWALLSHYWKEFFSA